MVAHVFADGVPDGKENALSLVVTGTITMWFAEVTTVSYTHLTLPTIYSV